MNNLENFEKKWDKDLKEIIMKLGNIVNLEHVILSDSDFTIEKKEELLEFVKEKSQ